MSIESAIGFYQPCERLLCLKKLAALQAAICFILALHWYFNLCLWFYTAASSVSIKLLKAITKDYFMGL